ncbi:cupin domain-containing protein [Niallia taxi]|uniref:cupin domain-containing protein n=1 Tax=Niallia taxi TaxID=2499688 RepID=UPI0021A664F8|nr:cupin domain-containing protein [Niallia taxi]MCT2346949.1 cupin domain-containing protein [Niallia taxi]
MNYQAINLNEKFSKFNERWSPKVIGEMNDYQFVLAGEMFIDFRDGQVKVTQGEMFIVPKGTEHKPFATQECHIMLVEPRGIVNTGDTKSALTAVNDIWI